MAGLSGTCAMCGAPLEWDPGEAATVCPHCGTVNRRDPSPSGPWGIERAELAELDLAEALATGLPGETPAAEFEQTETLACPGCGAEIVLDATTLADKCPFCATPLARAETHSHRRPKVQAVLPFALDEAAARAALGRWLGRLWFAPGDLARFARRDRPLEGVYLPYYTYDAAAEARYSGQRGDARYVSLGKNRRSRRIRWRPAGGTVRRRFDDVLVPASDTLGRRAEDDAFGAWDVQALHAYAPRFLAGFRAELPTLDLDEGWARAQATMERVLLADARAAIGGDEQRVQSLDASFQAVTFKHVLLPVWIAAYRFRGRSFAVAINARTGKVAGERPWSRAKIAIAVVAALLAAAALAWLYAASR